LEADETAMSLLLYYEVTVFERGLFSIAFANASGRIVHKGLLITVI